MKICCVASSGGHWEELMCLKKLLDKYECVFVTESGGQAEDSNIEVLYQVPQINRKENWFVLHFIKLIRTARVVLKNENPDLILTTGALIAFPFCVLGKMKKKRVVFIESFARVNNASLTGRLCYHFSDLFLIQWENLQKCYPKAKYVGGIF